jgi:membrane-associated phospholipid phosphatase
MNMKYSAQCRAWRCTFLCAIVFVMSSSALAQTSPSTSPTPTPSPAPQAKPAPSLEREFFKNILRDQRAIITSPFHLREGDAHFLLPISAATVSLIATDRYTAGALGNNRTRLTISRDISHLGDFYITGGVAASFYLIGRAGHSQRARETGLLGAEALIDSGIDVQLLKAMTQRPRPRVDDASGEFFDKGNSFPSGHAISAWALATVIAQEYRNHPLVRFGAYGVAAAVSASRFTGRNHYLSDVLVGSVLGYGIGRYVYRTHHVTANNGAGGNEGAEGAGRERSKLRPMITPTYSRRMHIYGATLAWNL